MRLGLGKEPEIPLLAPQSQIDPATLMRYIQQASDCDDPEKLNVEIRAFCDSRNRLFQSIAAGVYSETACVAHYVQATRLYRSLQGMGRALDRFLLSWTYGGARQTLGLQMEPAAARFAAAACVLRAGPEKLEDTQNKEEPNNQQNSAGDAIAQSEAKEAPASAYPSDPRIARLAAAAGHLYAAVRLANNTPGFLSGDASILANTMRAMAAEIELVHSLAVRAGNVEPYDEVRAAAL